MHETFSKFELLITLYQTNFNVQWWTGWKLGLKRIDMTRFEYNDPFCSNKLNTEFFLSLLWEVDVRRCFVVFISCWYCVTPWRSFARVTQPNDLMKGRKWTGNVHRGSLVRLFSLGLSLLEWVVLDKFHCNWPSTKCLYYFVQGLISYFFLWFRIFSFSPPSYRQARIIHRVSRKLYSRRSFFLQRIQTF